VARAKIREAEKAMAPVLREDVGLDAASLDVLVELVQRGVGKKQDVLRTALATGLRAMRTVHGGEDGPPEPTDGEAHIFQAVNEAEPARPGFTTNALAAAALGLASEPAQATIDPPPADDEEVVDE
jgi:hypothetical protein